MRDQGVCKPRVLEPVSSGCKVAKCLEGVNKKAV